MIELSVILEQRQSTINLIPRYGNDHVVVPNDSREISLAHSIQKAR